MKRSSFKFIPEEYFDCGDLGEHPIQFHAWVREDSHGDGSTRVGVDILIATVLFNAGDHTVLIPATSRLRELPATLRKYEEEIIQAWRMKYGLESGETA